MHEGHRHRSTLRLLPGGQHRLRAVRRLLRSVHSNKGGEHDLELPRHHQHLGNTRPVATRPRSGRRARTCTSTPPRASTTATRARREAVSPRPTAAPARAGSSSSTAAGRVVDAASGVTGIAGVGTGCAAARTRSAITSAAGIVQRTPRTWRPKMLWLVVDLGSCSRVEVRYEGERVPRCLWE